MTRLWLVALVITGGVLFLEVAIYAVPLVFSLWREPSIRHFILLSYNWQALIAGITAIIAAGIGACAVLYQTAQAKESERRSRDAKAEVAKLMILHLLSRIMSSVERSVIDLGVLLDQIDSDSHNHISLNLAGLGFEQIKPLCETVEFLAGREFISVYRLASVLQIVYARLEFLTEIAKRDRLTVMTIESRMVDLLEVYARSSSFLGYVRDRVGEPEKTLTVHNLSHYLFSVAASRIEFDQWRSRLTTRLESYTPFMRFTGANSMPE